MSDEIPRYIDEYSRTPESVPVEPQPVLSAETEPSGGETLPDQPLSGPDGDPSELPPTPEVAARSPKAMVIGLGLAATVLAAFLGYELVQAKESERLLDEAYGKAAAVEIRSKNLESDLRKSLSEKDLEIEAARADSRRLAENLAKEEEKYRILQAHADKAAAAVQAKASLAGDMDSLKSTYRELAKGMAKVEDEVRRLSGEVASRKTSSSTSKPTQKPLSAAERSVVQIASGPNKGRWYFATANGFRSPLYGSREGALRDAKLHARTGY
ncbi:MAG: hypothetical protein V4819_09420 [Verrucomicrobiota bacterium]